MSLYVVTIPIAETDVVQKDEDEVISSSELRDYDLKSRRRFCRKKKKRHSLEFTSISSSSRMSFNLSLIYFSSFSDSQKIKIRISASKSNSPRVLRQFARISLDTSVARATCCTCAIVLSREFQKPHSILVCPQINRFFQDVRSEAIGRTVSRFFRSFF